METSRALLWSDNQAKSGLRAAKLSITRIPTIIWEEKLVRKVQVMPNTRGPQTVASRLPSLESALAAPIVSRVLITAGLFVTDPGLGYPSGTHGSGPQTLHGTIHGVGGLIAFSSVAIASFVMARRFAGDPNWKGWALYSIVTGILVAVFFIAATTVSALDENGILPNLPTGLFQRIAIIVGWGWIGLMAMILSPIMLR